MGRNKGKSIYWLTYHVFVYTIATVLGWFLFLEFFDMPIDKILKLATITFVTHWLTDFITSKASGFCYLKFTDPSSTSRESEFYEWTFWFVIGVDQFIHATTLILTYKYLYPII